MDDIQIDEDVNPPEEIDRCSRPYEKATFCRSAKEMRFHRLLGEATALLAAGRSAGSRNPAADYLRKLGAEVEVSGRLGCEDPPLVA
ncbi:hypothetical protein PsorP6_002010 [Peronosclerospora sorghi]|uniref:Uncharacterized protein n=1 Tax=Peronosclerospora sorghi TaxID=230839 RepID=A0ACC0WXC1_9STRA|nr:hypothetical protein PsorP6_002010 [Peronosclerospora sorghi]